MKGQTGKKLSEFLAGAALVVVLILFAALALVSHSVTVHEGFENYPMNELVVFWWDNPLLSLAATAAAIAACMTVHRLIRAGKRLHMEKLLAALWILASMFWLWGAGVVPRADSKQVIDAALQFSKGDYSVLHMQYFHDYSFQLGFCLPLEIIARVCPALDLAMVMQLLNVLMCALMVVVMSRFVHEMEGTQYGGGAAGALYLLFLPMPFYCAYVYGTIPMMLFASLAFLYFSRFVHKGRSRDGWLFAVFIAAAVTLKPNAMVPLITLCIAAVLHALRGEKKVLLYAMGAAVLSLVLPKLVILHYELRAGVKMCGDISMLSRFVMGFQRSATGAGWFNNYTERFSPFVMPPQEAQLLLLADLKAIFAEFIKEPATLVRFMAEKCASMWLEPTYSALWHGAVSDVTGRFNGLANMVYLETGALRLPLERVMDAFQQAVYVLACIGTCASLKKRSDPVRMLLPVMVLGGFLYHALFEAKSQYIFVYAFFMMPLAAQGLVELERLAGRLYRKIRKRP